MQTDNLKAQLKQQPILYSSIVVLLLIGFGLRLFHLEQYPLGVNQDELSNIYDGYSIAETGADRWGQHFPVILRGFGSLDYRPPLYAWLSAGTIQVFGFSVASGRLVSALLGCLSLPLIFAVAKRIGGSMLAAFALLLVTFSPWHLLFSRIASEGTMLPPFFLISACYLWQRTREAKYKPGALALLGLCIGLGTNTYQAGKLLFFLFAVMCLVDLWQQRTRFFMKAVIFGASCLLGAMPQLIALLAAPGQFFARANGTREEYGFSFESFSNLFRALTSYFSPEFLFFSFKTYNNLSIGRLLMVEFLPFYIGLFFLYKVVNKKQAIGLGAFYFLLFIAVLPGVLTKDNPHALRGASLIVLLPLVTAAGIVIMYRALAMPWLRTAFLVVATILIVWNGLVDIKVYARSEDLRSRSMQVLLTKATQKLAAHKDNYKAIYIENGSNEPYIYVLTFCGIKPQEFQQAAIKVGQDKDGWDEFEKMGKYYFLSKKEIAARVEAAPSKSLMLLTERTSAYQPVDSVAHLGEKLYFYAYPAE
jgi:4-amino-4-deoxy-L-arabinose transferase-like glycosyltransferase